MRTGLLTGERGQGRLEPAWETCRQGLERFPDDVELRFREAMLLYEARRLPEAANALERLLDLRTERATMTARSNFMRIRQT